MPTIRRLIKPKLDAPETKDNFYTGRPWRRLRALKLKLNPMCEVSLAKGIPVKATTVDHRLSRRFWPELQYDLDNLVSMTTSVHNRKRNIESRITTRQQYINIFGAKGEGVLNV